MTSRIKLDVIGDPIDHSKSPLIHEIVLDGLGLDYQYRKVQVAKGGLEDYLADIQAGGICGFNLTMPHKVDIIPYLDFIDEEAQLFNSVNTVRVKSGQLYGYNTDGRGCIRAAEDLGYSFQGKNVVIFGAGGVVSTLALKVALEKAASITVLNRTLSSAQGIADNVFKKTGTKVRILPLDNENMNAAAEACDILINGTPLGMEGIDHNFEDLTFLSRLSGKALVYDLIYNPEETKLLRAAKKLGLNTLNGYGMLIYQGLLADEIFLDRTLDFTLYKGKIENKIKNLKNF